MGCQTYFQEVVSILSEIQTTQLEQIQQAAGIVANCVAEDGLLHTFGVGHSYLLAEDVCFRAGTLAPIHAIYEPSMTGSIHATKSTYMEKLEGSGEIILDYHRVAPPDALLVISNSGNNAAPIEVAMGAQTRGVAVIAVVSRRYMDSLEPRHSSGQKLGDVADVVIDNCGRVGDVCVCYDGLEQCVGPTSTVTGAFIINAVLVQVVQNLLRRGIVPPVFWSGNLPDGMEANKEYVDRYWGEDKEPLVSRRVSADGQLARGQPARRSALERQSREGQCCWRPLGHTRGSAHQAYSGTCDRGFSNTRPRAMRQWIGPRARGMLSDDVGDCRTPVQAHRAIQGPILGQGACACGRYLASAIRDGDSCVCSSLCYDLDHVGNLDRLLGLFCDA
jgi:uncharacterized phosphosugar-binding protein